MRHTGNRIGGSNPSLSANISFARSRCVAPVLGKLPVQAIDTALVTKGDRASPCTSHLGFRRVSSSPIIHVRPGFHPGNSPLKNGLVEICLKGRGTHDE